MNDAGALSVASLNHHRIHSSSFAHAGAPELILHYHLFSNDDDNDDRVGMIHEFTVL